jgi:hypothetical protein
MLSLLLVSSLAALLFIYFSMPSLWQAIIAVDDYLDAHEAGHALVASRKSYQCRHSVESLDDNSVTGNPFRESGPPVNMAKLVMLRHKVC